MFDTFFCFFPFFFRLWRLLLWFFPLDFLLLHLLCFLNLLLKTNLPFFKSSTHRFQNSSVFAITFFTCLSDSKEHAIRSLSVETFWNKFLFSQTLVLLKPIILREGLFLFFLQWILRLTLTILHMTFVSSLCTCTLLFHNDGANVLNVSSAPSRTSLA